MLTALAVFGFALPKPAVAAPLGLELIHRLIADRNVTSIEQLLNDLPTGLRQSYVLMFSSRSLQGATYRDPRVIMYTRNAELLLSFNGNPGERGYDSVEMMEFDGHENRVHFQELSFATTPDGSARPEFSEINPAKCAGCHGNPAHPIWDSHPVWPGAYGEVYQSTPSNEETQGLQEFLDHRSNNPRYAALLGMEAFKFRYAFRPVGKERYDGVHVEAPNAELTAMLSTLNFRAFAGELKRNSDFDVFRYAILGATRNACGDPASFFPAALRATIAARYQDFVADAALRDLKQRALRAQRLSPRHGSYQLSRGTDDYSALSRLRFLAQVAFGMDDEQWATDLEKGMGSFQTRLAAVQEFENAVLTELSVSDPLAKQLHLRDLQANDGRYCTYIAAQSQRSLTAALPRLAEVTRRLRPNGQEEAADDTSPR